ncbi:nuclear transport factor 2 family protein [Pectobacterium cacticida]|uniref:nuclear transport factor 2 family protein n=1 Tax=Pectobacterium cacticida TaxID=69221 RepID=UPI003985F610
MSDNNSRIEGIEPSIEAVHGPLTPREVAERYFERVAAFWSKPNDPQMLRMLVELFAERLEWDIPGNMQVVPWIGPRQDREGVASFFRELAEQITPERFEVWRILADDDMAVALGQLASRVKRTGSLIESPFAFVLTIRDGYIVGFRMLEDSYAVAVAAAE